jgi:ring-1,2-phenylacetyl-CoA epoxidase subunit PaaD
MVTEEQRAVEQTALGAERNQSRALDAATLAAAWTALGNVPDPEVPVVSIVELGIVRTLDIDGSTLVVTMTPTYSGCPATQVIEANIASALAALGIDVRIKTVLAPAWTTDWIAPEARSKLRDFGIAPPQGAARPIDVSALSRTKRPKASVTCPRCGSVHTQLIAQFGSTACKAQYRCDDCAEPFDYFKPH